MCGPARAHGHQLSNGNGESSEDLAAPSTGFPKPLGGAADSMIDDTSASDTSVPLVALLAEWQAGAEYAAPLEGTPTAALNLDWFFAGLDKMGGFAALQ